MLSYLLIITLYISGVICSKSCTQKNVSGVEGGEVVLRVHQTGIRTINWVLLSEGNLIVTTKPGRSIEDDDVLSQYRGRVRSEADGSLHINNLSLHDQRIYKIHIQTNEDEICVLFNLTVYERLSDGDIKIKHSFTRNDSCSLSLLCGVDKRDVTITWSNLNVSDINVTQGVLYVPPSDVNYTYICTASNPVSNVSKTVRPKEYCEPGIYNIFYTIRPISSSFGEGSITNDCLFCLRYFFFTVIVELLGSIKMEINIYVLTVSSSLMIGF
ncbi:SLAM family member 9-like [Anomaloglossus baeobatrachus]|uniref:SLAM family member 9-like n=1 Tax=Anomaloglossus baeobatrachus TaxID=238106 RepID=UPI003F4FFD67